MDLNYSCVFICLMLNLMEFPFLGYCWRWKCQKWIKIFFFFLILKVSCVIEWSDHKCIKLSSGKSSRQSTLVVIPGGDVVMLIVHFHTTYVIQFPSYRMKAWKLSFKMLSVLQHWMCGELWNESLFIAYEKERERERCALTFSRS